MLLTITTTHQPARDLGFLLHKHPDRFQTFPLPFGDVHVGFSEATDERCTAVMVLDIDPLALTRRRGGRTLYEYVNDRPYVASSFLSVAIARVFGSALKGRSDARPRLVAAPLPLIAEVVSVPCRDGDGFARALFEPLGYAVHLSTAPLDERFPEWGASHHHTMTLEGRVRLQQLLGHLYVLLPVLDDAKHYWVEEDEIDKLLRHGKQWLSAHPLRDEITHRYLRRHRHLSRKAVERLEEESGTVGAVIDDGETAVPAPRLRDLRFDAVVAELKGSGARSVVDLGCGEGALLVRLVGEPQFTRVVGADVALRSLRRAETRLRLDQLAPAQRERCELVHSSLTYRDPRLEGFDAAAVVEVVEHLEPSRLPAFEKAVFAAARPATVVLTTPNAEHNVRFDLPAGTFRHEDHRFEWTRAEFRSWAGRVADDHGYAVDLRSVGDDDPEVGAPTQMAVFTRLPLRPANHT